MWNDTSISKQKIMYCSLDVVAAFRVFWGGISTFLFSPDPTSKSVCCVVFFFSKIKLSSKCGCKIDETNHLALTVLLTIISFNVNSLSQKEKRKLLAGCSALIC